MFRLFVFFQIIFCIQLFSNNIEISQFALSQDSMAHTYDKDRVSFIGGKAYSLECLDKLPEINVPNWFCITVKEYEDFFIQNKELAALKRKFEKLQYIYGQELDDLQNNRIEKKIYKLSRKMQKKVMAEKLSPSFVNQIKRALFEQNDRYRMDFPYVVRSSATVEDSSEHSFAGLFDSYLNLSNMQDILKAVKKCWASVFNQRVVEHCLYNKCNIFDIKMAVVVQQMIDSKISGTAFNLDTSSNIPMNQIIASYGVGAIVDGEVTGDCYVIHPENDIIIKRILGDKKTYNFRRKSNGVIKKNTPQYMQGKYALNTDQAIQISRCITTLGKYYKDNYGVEFIDAEFAYDHNGVLYFVQVRPLINRSTKRVKLDLKKQPHLKKILMGKHSILGVATGKVKIVNNFKELESGKVIIEKDDILVTHRSTNYYTPYIRNLKGIVTIEGTPTSHPILISRERGIPCIIGVRDAIEKLRPYEGQYITIDGEKKEIYLGKLDEKELQEVDFENDYQIVPIMQDTEEKHIVDDLLKRKRLIVRDGEYWLLNPKGKLSMPLLEIQEKAHALRVKHINDARNHFKINYSFKTRIINNKVYAYWDPLPIQNILYKGMDINECENFLKGYQASVLNYEQKTMKLFDHPLSWDDYMDAASSMYGYMLESYVYKKYLNEQTAKLANQLKIPIFFFEEYCDYIQKHFIEEDVLLKKEAQNLGNLINNYCENNGLDWNELSLEILENKNSKIYSKIKEFSQKYKFSLSEDFLEEPPIEQAFRVIKMLPKDYQYFVPIPQEEDYFPNNPELKRWIQLSIEAKLIHNNVHHIRMRGVWSLRKFLLLYGDKMVERRRLKTSTDILKLSCVEIRSILQDYNE